MTMRIIKFTTLLILLIVAGCTQDRTVCLKKNGDEKMTYYASEKKGYSIEVFQYIAGEYTQYAFSLNGNGEIMYVYRTRVNKANNEVTAAGPTWYLVSDTTDKLYGAKLFERDILGYYGSSDRNFISDNNFKGQSAPFLEQEKLMFTELAGLMEKKNEHLISINTAHLFWFRYDLN